MAQATLAAAAPETVQDNPEYGPGRELMELMVQNSQRPGGGNEAFVDALWEPVAAMNLHVSTLQDPDRPDRSLLIVDVGDPEGEQVLVAVSHSDVVDVTGQDWETDPWELSEESDLWLGRGTCDTHGSGVSMLLAAARPEVRQTLEEANTRASIIFTYDEEATTPELSMRGARLAVGALGGKAVAESRYFIAGEPTQEYTALTQTYGPILPMRAHKGRFLADFNVHVSNPGHVSELVQNAFMSGTEIVQAIGEFDFAGLSQRDGLREAHIFSPAHSTAQVSAGRIKEGDFSISPSDAGFVMDMRTIPGEHEELVEEISALIKEGVSEEGVSVLLTTLKNALGSSTPEDSPIVRAAQEAVGGFPARGFNGGDEGRIFRLDGGKEGITLGPGSLKYAHQPNEQVPIKSVFDAADIYAKLFAAAVELPR